VGMSGTELLALLRSKDAIEEGRACNVCMH
jgi:hypothetical protein